MTADHETMAVTELAELADGRGDLLAQHAGIALGIADEQPESPYLDHYRKEAELCIRAGADTKQIRHWKQVGQKRATAATQVPHTG